MVLERSLRWTRVSLSLPSASIAWVSDNDLGVNTLGMTALAQSALIVAANLALGGFLAALIEID